MKEITAKNVRVGNFIQTEYEGTLEIININSEGFGYIDARKPTFKAVGRFDADEVSPITITEEWHNRFGVKRNADKNFEYKIGEKQVIAFSNMDGYVYILDIESEDGVRSEEDEICTLWNKEIKGRDMYVHEWQNLYFAISGEELKEVVNENHPF